LGVTCGDDFDFQKETAAALEEEVRVLKVWLEVELGDCDVVVDF